MDEHDDELLARLGLDEELSAFVHAELKELECGSIADYLRWLVKHERWNKIKKNVTQLIEEGIESGPAVALTADFWTGIIPGFVAKESKKLIGASWPISCRPMVTRDLKMLLAEIAPDSDEAACQFLQTVAWTIAAIGRNPARACTMAGFEPKGLTMQPVGHSVARVACLVSPALGIDVVRVLHRDKHQVLTRHIDSSWD